MSSPVALDGRTAVAFRWRPVRWFGGIRETEAAVSTSPANAPTRAATLMSGRPEVAVEVDFGVADDWNFDVLNLFCPIFSLLFFFTLVFPSCTTRVSEERRCGE